MVKKDKEFKKAKRYVILSFNEEAQIKAESIVIQSIDEAVSEYWVRIGDPAAVTGEAEEDWEGR
jgi:hypothetical protein